MSAARESWGSRLGFILASAGSAVGLGNIWRFPYITGENGGALFILVYLACVVVLGLPVMIAEMTLGRAAQKNPVGAYRVLAPGTPWYMVGAMGVVAGFIILSFYAVVAGWTLGYVVESLRGALSTSNAEELKAHFDAFIASPAIALPYFVAMMVLSMWVVGRGVASGIERWSKVLMPALFVMLLVVIARSLTLDGAFKGVVFLFRPDVSKLSADVMLKAMGQAFFSMSLGMGAMLTYGSYLSRRENVPSSAVFVGGLDLLVAILGGLAVFPALFAFGLDPQAGPGLVFITLPAIFAQIPLGSVAMTLFFLLLVVAALTSTISLVEVIAAHFIDDRGWSRRRAVWTMGGLCTLLGVPSALSAGPLSREVLGFDFMGLAEHLSADYLLPLGALLMSVFVGFVWKREAVLDEVLAGCDRFPLAGLWLTIVRWLAPFIVGQILLLGLLNEFASFKDAVSVLTAALSLVDAALVLGAIAGAGVVLLRRREAKR